MRIRKFRNRDFAAGLGECLAALAPTFFRDAGSLVATFRSLRRQAGIRTYVAVCGREVLGTASLFVEPRFVRGGCRVAHLEDVAVRPDRRGSGVGRALVAHCVAAARAGGCYKVMLACSGANMPFYEKSGFRVGPDTLMRLDLLPAATAASGAVP